MNSPETNDPIERLLREQDTHVADNGFTRRVIERLPRRNSLFPRVILLALVIAGSLLAERWLPWKTLPPLDYVKLLSLDSALLSAWLPFGMVIGVLASALIRALGWKD